MERSNLFFFTFKEANNTGMKLNAIFCLRLALLSLTVGLSGLGLCQRVAIGDTSLGIVPTASFQLLDTSRGFMINRLTTAQRNAIANPATGLQIFNVSNRCLEIFFPGTGWKSISCECTVAPLAPASIQGPAQVCPGDTVLFSILAVSGATQYQWSIPSGSIVVSGVGTDSIRVKLGQNSGIVSVIAQNGCGNSALTSRSITVAFPDSTFTVSPQSPSINSQALFTALQLGASYSWTFSSGTPATSTQATQGVTWTQAGNYNVGLTVTLYPGCFSSSSQNITVNACPPPLQNSVSFSYTGSVQNWTVPACATSIRIQASGGQGGNSQGGSPGQGGLGARMQGDFQVNPGTVLTIIVGKQGNTNGASGGGGGGSGVLVQGSPWIIAGGGGGINNAQNFGGLAGTTSTSGSTGEYGGGSGGSNGGDGGWTVYSGSNFAYGGKGLNAGANGSTGTNGVSNLTTTTQGVYGLGGGGGSVGGGYCNCGGGGGGYSGGGAGGVNGSGGGGGSYNNGTNQINQGGVQSGNGQVVILY